MNKNFKVGDKVWTYYPVSHDFCWEGEIIDIKGDQIKVKCDGFDLSDWFNIVNITRINPTTNGTEPKLIV